MEDTLEKEVVETNVTPQSQEVEDRPAVEVAKRLSREIKEPVFFSQANLMLKCYKCQSDEILHPDVVGGLRFDMYTTDQHEIALSCKSCGNRMKLYYKDTTPVNTEDDEQILEENKNEEQV